MNIEEFKTIQASLLEAESDEKDRIKAEFIKEYTDTYISSIEDDIDAVFAESNAKGVAEEAFWSEVSKDNMYDNMGDFLCDELCELLPDCHPTKELANYVVDGDYEAFIKEYEKCIQ